MMQLFELLHHSAAAAVTSSQHQQRHWAAQGATGILVAFIWRLVASRFWYALAVLEHAEVLLV